MRRTEEPLMALVEIILDGVAMNEAALARDWDEARFRCRLLAAGAAEAGLIDVGVAAAALSEILGPVGSEPQAGYGAAILAVSAEIDALRTA